MSGKELEKVAEEMDAREELPRPIRGLEDVKWLVRRGWHLNTYTRKGKKYYRLRKYFKSLGRRTKHIPAELYPQLEEQIHELTELMWEAVEEAKRVAREKAAEEELKRAEKLEKEVKRAAKPLHEREIEDQAWWKNLCYELGRRTFFRFNPYVKVDFNEVDIENWEEAMEAIWRKAEEAHKFWEEKPDIRVLQDDLRVMELDRDMYMESARKLLVALRQTSALLQTALTLMPKEALEKFTMLVSMADLTQLEPVVELLRRRGVA